MLFLMESLLTALDRAGAAFRRTAHVTHAQRQGLAGERAAYFHLRRMGFTVVARRWRHALLNGEVDLIAWEGETLAFVEVKTRAQSAAFAAEFQVDKRKMEALRRMAEAYVRQLPWKPGRQPNVQPRFDVVSVYLRPDGSADIQLLRNFFR